MFISQCACFLCFKCACSLQALDVAAKAAEGVPKPSVASSTDTAETCAVCQRPWLAPGPSSKASGWTTLKTQPGKVYHQECIRCKACGQTAATYYLEDNGSTIYDAVCWKKWRRDQFEKSRPVCSCCKELIPEEVCFCARQSCGLIVCCLLQNSEPLVQWPMPASLENVVARGRRAVHILIAMSLRLDCSLLAHSTPLHGPATSGESRSAAVATSYLIHRRSDA